MRIRTKVEFSGVPKDTTGIAIRDFSGGEMLWKVAWELKTDCLGLPRGRPLIDWFTQDEFDEFLETI